MYHLKLFHAGDGAAHLHVNVEGSPGVLSATHVLSSGDSRMFEIADEARILATFRDAPVPAGAKATPQPILRRIVVQKSRGEAPLTVGQGAKKLKGRGDIFSLNDKFQKLGELALGPDMTERAKRNAIENLPEAWGTYADKPTLFEIDPAGGEIEIRPGTGGGLDA